MLTDFASGIGTLRLWARHYSEENSDPCLRIFQHKILTPCLGTLCKKIDPLERHSPVCRILDAYPLPPMGLVARWYSWRAIISPWRVLKNEFYYTKTWENWKRTFTFCYEKTVLIGIKTGFRNSLWVVQVWCWDYSYSELYRAYWP